MKLIRISLLIIILSLSVLSAGQTFYIESPSNIQHQTIEVGLKDRIEFSMLSGNHTIVLDKIKPTTGFIELDIHPYINKNAQDREVVYINIDKTHFATIDLNKDYINDLEIRLVNLNEDRASLQFDRINKSIFPENPKPIINPVKEVEKEEDIITPIAITVLVFAIMFIIYLLVFKKPKA